MSAMASTDSGYTILNETNVFPPNSVADDISTSSACKKVINTASIIDCLYASDVYEPGICMLKITMLLDHSASPIFCTVNPSFKSCGSPFAARFKFTCAASTCSTIAVALKSSANDTLTWIVEIDKSISCEMILTPTACGYDARIANSMLLVSVTGSYSINLSDNMYEFLVTVLIS